MTKHREILRLTSMGLSQAAIAASFQILYIIGLLREREASQANDGGSVEVPLSELLSPGKSGGHLSKSPLFHDAIVGGVPSQDASTADLMADVISALKELK